jgi:tetrapyrrole methylase family protein / MazG family protein
MGKQKVALQNVDLTVMRASQKMEKLSGITLLGLGPGDPNLLTRQAWDVLNNSTEIYLRTDHHPVVSSLPAGIKIYSFDDLYEKGDTFELVYAAIVERVLELGRRSQGVVYAVPGHPFIAETTSPEIARRAKEEGIQVHVVEGLSFLGPTFTALGLDPFPRTALVDGFELAAAHVPNFAPDTPALIAQIHSRAIASEVKLTLMEVYPDTHPVKLVHAAGTPEFRVEDMQLYEIDRSRSTELLTTLYVPPLGVGTSLESFQEVIAALRAPDGCPWDREQTHRSLRPYLLEETYEVLSALDAEDPASLSEELGDLLLQIVLHAQIASEAGEFNMAEVVRGIHAKIINRHPHVFGDVKLRDAEGVLQNWERLKAAERQANGKTEAGLLDSVALALPALVQAQTYQQRAGRVGFDWRDIQGVHDKVDEEISEVRSAAHADARAAEIGDLLFSVVNLARWYNVDAESVLREANARFRRRFGFIERAARKEGRNLQELTLEEMDGYWEEAKKSGEPPENSE